MIERGPDRRKGKLQTAEHHRVPQLDGVRGLAIVAVVIGHLANGVWPVYRGLAPELGSRGGLAGVQLFLVLSGYLITGILMRQRAAGRLDLIVFYKRRARRLYPTLLVVAAVVLVWSGDIAGVLRAVTYTENLPGGNHGWLSHTWSLAVEEQFYLAWPALLVVSGRWAKHAAGVGIVATLAAQHVVDPDTAYTMLRWDALLAGCLLALIGWRCPARWFGAGFVVLVAYTSGLVPSSHTPWHYPVLTVASVLVVAGACDVGWLRAGWLVHLGVISYALYLWHVLVMRFDVPVVVSLAAAFVLAEVTYEFVDRRAQRRPEREEAPAPAVAEAGAATAVLR